MKPRFSLGYRRSLDGVRAIAILPVIAFHYRHADNWIPTRGGYLGVDIFFVLSGFLITSLLCEELVKTGRLRFRLFYLRRVLRLFPALFTMITVYVIWATTLGPDRWVHSELRQAGATLLYVENWFRAFAMGHSPPEGANGLAMTWSLSVEEQFYLLWPLLLFLLIRFRGFRAASVFAACGLIASASFRATAPLLALSPQRRWNEFFFTRPDGLLVGCLLALLLAQGVRWRPPRLLGWAAACAVAVFLAATVYTSSYMLRYGFIAFALIVGLALWGVVTRPDWAITRLLAREPLVGIGRISYGLYLWHMPVYVAVEKYAGRPAHTAPVAVVVTFLVTYASYRYIEKPFLRLKGRLNPVTSRVPEAPREEAIPEAALPATGR